jgi:signal peptidase I
MQITAKLIHYRSAAGSRAHARTPSVGKSPTGLEPDEPQSDILAEEEQSRRHQVAAELTKTLMMALIIFLSARLLILPYQVDGRSMSPNLEDRERVLVNRAVYMHLNLEQLVDWIPGVDASNTAYYPFHSPEPGDIVVLNPPAASDQPYIKRTVAVGGDVVDIEQGRVYVNGVLLHEPYIEGAITECIKPLYCHEYTVPDGMIYVLGDNRQHSSDSRFFGPVPLDNVIGKAWFSNWPADKIGPIPHYSYDELAE